MNKIKKENKGLENKGKLKSTKQKMMKNFPLDSREMRTLWKVKIRWGKKRDN